MNPSKIATAWTRIAIAVALTLATSHAAGAAPSPAPVELGIATDFVVLTKTGITNVPPSDITGDLGTSPIDSTAITGLTLILDSTGKFSTSTQVAGKVYAADYAVPTPSRLTTAVSNMETAYTDAAGRSLPDFTELYSGDLSGRTLAPGLYKWSTGVLITTNVTLDGPADAVWIFQISSNLTVGTDAAVLLRGGANANNIFWQVGGGVGVEIGTGAHFEGTILAAKAIHFRTGSSLAGRALSQTATTLEMNALTISTAPTTSTTSTSSTTSTTILSNCEISCADPEAPFGKITASDALFILRAAVELVPCQLCGCDVDDSGAILASDALRTLRYAVGLPVVLDCPPFVTGT